MAIATAWFRSRSNRAYRNVRERLGLVTATLAEDIAGMRVVQSFTREPVQQKAFHGVNDRYRDANYETVVLNGIYFPIVDLLASAATAIVFGYGGWLVYHGQMTAGTLFAFALYLSNFFDPIQQLSQLYNTFLSAIAALDKIIGVLDEKPQVVDGADATELPRIEGHVRFDGVRFGYGPEFPEVLHGLDLDVPAGTTVALVGHTGAGKSTIAKLIARFYDPTKGSLSIDGHDLRDVTQRSLQAPARNRPAGGLPLRRHSRGEHRLRPSRRPAGGDRGRRRGRRGAALHPRARGRLSRRSSASAAPASRSVSASSSPSPVPSSPTRAS